MRERDELEGMLHDAAGHLSAAHVAALVAHPEAVCSALAAAADALTANDRERTGADMIAGPASATVEADEGDRRLAARTRTGAPEALLTSEELAARTRLRTRQSVHDWRRKGRIVGWQNARRGYVFPAAQLDERNRPLAGLDQVTGLFADGYAAWVWLTTARPSLDGAEPLALLVRGEVERVAEAATSSNSAVTAAPISRRAPARKNSVRGPKPALAPPAKPQYRSSGAVCSSCRNRDVRNSISARKRRTSQLIRTPVSTTGLNRGGTP